MAPLRKAANTSNQRRSASGRPRRDRVGGHGGVLIRGTREGRRRIVRTVIRCRTRNQARSSSAGPTDAISKSRTAAMVMSSATRTLPSWTSPHSSEAGGSGSGSRRRHHVTASANTAGVSPSAAHARYCAHRSTSPARVASRVAGAPPGRKSQRRRRCRCRGCRPGDRESRRAGAPARAGAASANQPVRRKGVSARTTRPARWGMRRKGAPTQTSSSSTATGTTAGSPAPATVSWTGPERRGRRAGTVRPRSAGAGPPGTDSSGLGPVDLDEERLAREASGRPAYGGNPWSGTAGTARPQPPGESLAHCFEVVWCGDPHGATDTIVGSR